jgi:CHASE3 domain sensor protein
MWTFGRKIAAGFSLALVLLTAIGFVAYRSINSLVNTSQLVTHSHEVKQHVTDLLSLLKDAETGQRGFVITGEDPYLAPYQAALDGIPKAIKELRTLTIDSPTQQKRMDQLEPLIGEKLFELHRTVEMRRKGQIKKQLGLCAGEWARSIWTIFVW